MQCPYCGKELRIPNYIEEEIRRLLNTYGIPGVILQCNNCYRWLEIRKDGIRRFNEHGKNRGNTE